MIISLKCPNCGAGEINQFNICQFCNSKVLVKEKGVTLITQNFSCFSCKSLNKEKNEFCESCGEKLIKKCNHCGGKHHIKSRFCPVIGKALEEAVTKQEALTAVHISRIDVKKLLERVISEDIN